MKQNIERRAFLKTAAVGVSAVMGAGMLAACAPKQAGQEKGAPGSTSAADIAWDQETDVVVIGGGGTGLSAAIEASDAGSSVVVLEKGAYTGGTTALSSGAIQAAGTKYQAEYAGVSDDTPEKHVAYMLEVGDGLMDEDLVRKLCGGLGETVDWLVDLGLELDQGVTYLSHLPFTTNSENFKPRSHTPKGGLADNNGRSITDVLLKGAQDRGAEIMLETEGVHLVMDNGAIVGVQAKNKGKDLFLKANKGVIVATASIDHNEEMAKRINPCQYYELTEQSSMAAATNTGDGIRMGLEVGADLSGTGGTMGVALGAIGGTFDGVAFDAICVNGGGRRFCCEDAQYAYAARQVYEERQRTHKDVYVVFDETAKTTNPLSPLADSETEEKAAKDGLLLKADSIAALAQAMGVPEKELQREIDAWNNDVVATGVDHAYGRNAGLGAIATAPYYAMIPTTMGLGSLGGLRIDTECRVLNTAGEPIANLYAGGLATGGWFGKYYPGSGTAIGAALYFGRVAGQNAAKGTPAS